MSGPKRHMRQRPAWAAKSAHAVAVVARNRAQDRPGRAGPDAGARAILAGLGLTLDSVRRIGGAR